MQTKLILSKRLKAILEEQGMRAADLARKSGVPRSVLSDWMAGAAPKHLVQVMTVAQVLGTDIEDLCFGVARPGQGEINGAWVVGVFEGRIRRVK